MIYTSWACGGTPVKFQLPLPLFGIALFGMLFAVPAICRDRDEESIGASIGRSAVRLLKDPVFIVGGLFLALLTVQWLNAGRYLFFSPLTKAWDYTAPAVAWLPSAFTRRDAAEMLVWFFPAWTVILTVRSHGISRDALTTLFTWMAGNGAVLALLGILQYATGSQSVFWTREIPGAIFFSSFIYANHAGDFFALMFCLSAGLAIRDLYSQTPFRLGLRQMILPAFALMNLAGATFSLSRAEIVLVWPACAVIICYTIARGWKRLTPAYRLKLAAGLVGAAIFLLFIIGSLPGHSVFEELSTLGMFNNTAIVLENGRVILMKAAVECWQHAPWFGAGGWGFAYLLPLHIRDWTGPLTPGFANVHNDLLQFLVEFGVVGTGLMAIIVAILAWPIIRTKIWRYPIAFCSVLGLALTLIHSMLDLPFRCPAILYSWLAILAGVGRKCRA